MNILKLLSDFFSCPTKEPIRLNSFNNLPDGVFTLELDGKIIDVNNKILSLYDTTRFNILGRYFSDFVEGGSAILNKAIQTDSPVCAKAKHLDDENKEDLYFEISASKNDEINRVYAIIRDVTQTHIEKNVMNEKYTVAKKIIDGKNDFLITSSGAILSTLVSISGFSRALLDGIGGGLSDKQKKYLNIINTSSRDLNYDLEKLFALFKLESKQTEYKYRVFDLISMIKSIERIYQKDIKDKKINFSLDYQGLYKRDCYLDGEIIEYILRCVMDMFVRFANLGKCSFNIGHPPVEFLKSKDFASKENVENIEEDKAKEICEKYVLFEAKLQDLVFNKDELENIYDSYYQGETKRPIGLKATLNLLKKYITDFKGDIWIYSKPNFGTMMTFVLPLKEPVAEVKTEIIEEKEEGFENVPKGLDALYNSKINILDDLDEGKKD